MPGAPWLSTGMHLLGSGPNSPNSPARLPLATMWSQQEYRPKVKLRVLSRVNRISRHALVSLWLPQTESQVAFARICHVPSISTKSHITITRVRVINVRNNYILGAKEATLLNKLCLVRVMHWVCSELGFKPWVSDSESRVLFVKSFLFLLWITWEVECCLPSATLGRDQGFLWLACLPSVPSGLSTEAGPDCPGPQRTPHSRGEDSEQTGWCEWQGDV